MDREHEFEHVHKTYEDGSKKRQVVTWPGYMDQKELARRLHDGWRLVRVVPLDKGREKGNESDAL